jgi:hypothetical protein
MCFIREIKLAISNLFSLLEYDTYLIIRIESTTYFDINHIFTHICKFVSLQQNQLDALISQIYFGMKLPV